MSRADGPPLSPRSASMPSEPRVTRNSSREPGRVVACDATADAGVAGRKAEAHGPVPAARARSCVETEGEPSWKSGRFAGADVPAWRSATYIAVSGPGVEEMKPGSRDLRGASMIDETGGRRIVRRWLRRRASHAACRDAREHEGHPAARRTPRPAVRRLQPPGPDPARTDQVRGAKTLWPRSGCRRRPRTARRGDASRRISVDAARGRLMVPRACGAQDHARSAAPIPRRGQGQRHVAGQRGGGDKGMPDRPPCEVRPHLVEIERLQAADQLGARRAGVAA